MSNPPPLKTDPRYGVFPWWPEDGDAWLHPDDVPLARRTIPGPRVWRRDGAADGFVVLSYGGDRMRVKPRLWQEVPAPEFEIGDLVEVLPHGMQNDPHTGHVREVLWDEHARQLHYRIDSCERVLETDFTADDLKHVDQTQAEPMLRIEPTASDAEVDELLDGLPGKVLPTDSADEGGW